jgi:ligand-binding sensor protein
MKIQDFCDMNKFEQIMKNWAGSTGLATVAVGADGKYISDCYNFTEFCIDLTRGSAEGKKRCEQCDREGHGVYPCHAGLVDFGIPITLEDGTVLGSIIGGQVLPENPDEEKFRQTARELGIDEDKYIKALKKVNVKTKEQISLLACPAACFAAWEVLLRSIFEEILLNWYFSFFSANVVFFVCCL